MWGLECWLCGHLGETWLQIIPVPQKPQDRVLLTLIMSGLSFRNTWYTDAWLYFHWNTMSSYESVRTLRPWFLKGVHKHNSFPFHFPFPLIHPMNIYCNKWYKNQCHILMDAVLEIQSTLGEPGESAPPFKGRGLRLRMEGRPGDWCLVGSGTSRRPSDPSHWVSLPLKVAVQVAWWGPWSFSLYFSFWVTLNAISIYKNLKL